MNEMADEGVEIICDVITNEVRDGAMENLMAGATQSGKWCLLNLNGQLWQLICVLKFEVCDLILPRFAKRGVKLINLVGICSFTPNARSFVRGDGVKVMMCCTRMYSYNERFTGAGLHWPVLA
jgi:hypothetical protein